jgi:RNA polymerase sigma-70 factor (ECF subfamily)
MPDLKRPGQLDIRLKTGSAANSDAVPVKVTVRVGLAGADVDARTVSHVPCGWADRGSCFPARPIHYDQSPIANQTSGSAGSSAVVTFIASANRQLDPDTLGDHVDRLYRAAWALCGSREGAEDLVQETFARVLRKPRLLSGENDIGYLLCALRNVHLSECRARSRRPLTAPLHEDAYELDDPKAVDPQARLESLDVYAAIAALPEHLRDAVVAVDLVGMSYQEAARLIGVKEATITTRLHRGRRRIAQTLSHEPCSSEPHALVA